MYTNNTNTKVFDVLVLTLGYAKIVETFRESRLDGLLQDYPKRIEDLETQLSFAVDMREIAHQLESLSCFVSVPDFAPLKKLVKEGWIISMLSDPDHFKAIEYAKKEEKMIAILVYHQDLLIGTLTEKDIHI